MKGWGFLLVVFVLGMLLGPSIKRAWGKVQAVLLAAMVLLIVGYSMMFAAFHGHWQFWKYWLPSSPVNVNA